MLGELIFDCKGLVVVKDVVSGRFYAIDKEKYQSVRDEVHELLRKTYLTSRQVDYPALDAILIVEKEEGIFDLSNEKAEISFENLKGVLIENY